MAVFSQMSPNGDFLDINNVKARINPAGDLFRDLSTAQFEVPKGSGKHTFFAGHLWIGGIDTGGQLHVAGQTYRLVGDDFYYGPFPGSSQSPQWNRVWKINKTTVDSCRLGLYQTLPQIILDWPGNGNPAQGQSQNLAPYIDLNGNNIYEPQNGECPCMRGDQSIYFIFNDDSVHTETGGKKLGIEIHGMAYAFNLPSNTALHHTIFIKYIIKNRSTNQYDSVYVGLWTDPELGAYYVDDFVGCHVEKSAYYVYNGNVYDDLPMGYGKFPPAQAVLFAHAASYDTIHDGVDNNHNCIVDEPGEKWVMSNFIYYENMIGPFGNPSGPNHFYNYLKSVWGDGTPVVYDGQNGYDPNTVAPGFPNPAPPCNYMFPGTSDQQYGWGTGGNCSAPNVLPPWDEITAGNLPSDRRGVGSYGPFTLMPNGELCLDFAFVWARTKDTINDTLSIFALQNAIDSVHNFFDSKMLFACDCSMPPLGVFENSSYAPVQVFPNPSSGIIFIKYKPKSSYLQLEIIDFLGKKVSDFPIPAFHSEKQVDISHLPQGVYLLKVKDGETIFLNRFIKN